MLWGPAILSSPRSRYRISSLVLSLQPRLRRRFGRAWRQKQDSTEGAVQPHVRTASAVVNSCTHTGAVAPAGRANATA